MTNFISYDEFNNFLSELAMLLVENEQKLFQTNRKLSMPGADFVELFRLLYFSALRVSEALYLKASDVDLDKRILTLRVTKTGYKKCNACKGSGCEKCDQRGKLRKPQYTTIHPWNIPTLYMCVAVKNHDEYLFNTNRYTLWNYAKKAGKRAGLKVFEQQDNRLIEGVWTHLFRKSRAQQMILDGKAAGEDRDYLLELVKIKLRHSTNKDVTNRYTNAIGQKLTINDLLEWEKKHYPLQP